MARPPRKPDLNAIVRNAMIDAAISVFAEKGYSGATMNEIAAAAGYTAPAFYNYFKGKQELFEALLDRMTLDLGSSISGPSKGHSFELSVEAHFRSVFELIERHPAMFAVAVSIRVNPRALPSARVSKLYHEAERRRREKHAAWFADVADTERIGIVTSTDMVTFFGGIVHGLYLQWMTEVEALGEEANGRLVARVPLALQLFFRGISGTIGECSQGATGTKRRKAR